MITKLEAGTKLYHGSYCEVSDPDISKCRKFKDFGQGFYLTTDIEQAKRFAEITLSKAKKSGTVPAFSRNKAVSCFEFVPDDTLNIKYFETSDKDWLHCIVGHRADNSFPAAVREMADYDIIGGKIANDDTNTTIYAYILGAYGAVGSEKADEMCINLLLPDRLKDQYCFRTQKALDRLVFRKGIML